MLLDWSLHKTTIDDRKGQVFYTFMVEPCEADEDARPLTLQEVELVGQKAARILNTWIHSGSGE